MAITTTSRSRTFCCCIPVRAGVITLSIIGIIGGSGLTALGCLGLMQGTITEATRITNGILVGIYTVLAIVSFLGLVGAIIKKRGLINLYFAILLGHLIFSFALGVYAMYRTFRDSSEYMRKCQSDSEHESVNKVCREGDTLMKGLVVSVSIIAWLLEIWACVIVFNYSRQLVEEEETKTVVEDNEAW